MRHTVDHVFLTRFNLPSRGAESYIRAREGWLRERADLFERFTVPSVRAQTAANVSWVVYLDPQSPAWLISRMNELAREGLLSPVYREEVSREELLGDLRSAVGTTASWLLTTNLDNDDGLSRDFSERVQASVVGQSRRVIYVDRGLILAGSRLYLRKDHHNAFCSVADTWDDPMTCWSAWHTELDRHLPAAHVSGGPAWLQVIHGNNVSNRVRGRLTSPTRHREAFGATIGMVPPPSWSAHAADLVIGQPTRTTREVARASAKRLLLALGGRRGMEAAHERWNSLRAKLDRRAN